MTKDFRDIFGVWMLDGNPENGLSVFSQSALKYTLMCQWIKEVLRDEGRHSKVDIKREPLAKQELEHITDVMKGRLAIEEEFRTLKHTLRDGLYSPSNKNEVSRFEEGCTKMYQFLRDITSAMAKDMCVAHKHNCSA